MESHPPIYQASTITFLSLADNNRTRSKMEGLIPFVYKAIVQYKNGKEGPLGSLFSESPSYSYMRLPAGDSGRFQHSASALLSDYGFNSAASSSSSATQVLASAGVQSPRRRLNPRRGSAAKSA